MKAVRKLSRRSFMTRVAGGAVVGGGALVALTGRAEAFQVTDADDGANADPAGRGRGGPANRIRGCTDGDTGARADPGGAGRGNRRTDSDAGPGSDPARCGRR
ncbi:MAG: twin-arginine translocation signal domain-containing protein [Sphingosinicella sp.]|uniref:twin-arginine translocation signal domain-containing protein n=1 Tax=Sphingosinicella sp. TaxID=1917971 RepID=UPI004037FA02